MAVQKIKMAFTCQNRLEQKGSNKYFCYQCNKEVLDFRRSDISTVISTVSVSKNICGIIKGNLDVNYPSFGISGRLVKSVLMASMSSVVLFPASAQYSDTLKYPPIIQTELSRETKSGKAPTDKMEKVTEKDSPKFDQKAESQWEYGIFFSKRFPFIYFRRSLYLTGLLCPADYW